jgi:hypothetical protein
MSKFSARNVFGFPATGGNPVATFQSPKGTTVSVAGERKFPSGYIRSATLFQYA